MLHTAKDFEKGLFWFGKNLIYGFVYRFIALILIAALIQYAVPTVPEAADASTTGTQSVQGGKRTFKILCLGDSITQGKSRDPEPDMQSYRYQLWKYLMDGGYGFDFVGSINTNFESMCDYPEYKGQAFDRDHEGHWGWRIDGINEKLPGWLATYAADMALVMLGTNDVGNSESVSQVVEEMKQTIGILRGKNPKITIFLGLPFQEWYPFPEMEDEFTALAEELSTADSNIIPVTHSKGWVSNPGFEKPCTFDWVHTSRLGEEKLAQNWFKAMKPYLDGTASVKKPSGTGEKDTSKAAIKVMLNKKALNMKYQPTLSGNNVLVPGEVFVKALGGTYKYNSKTKEISVRKVKTAILLKLGDKTAKVGSKKYSAEAAPALINKVVYVPAKFVAEKLGYKYSFDSKSKVVSIGKK